jgi:hypothetical protein
VRDLEDLRDAFEARAAVGAEEAFGTVDDVAAVAIEACVGSNRDAVGAPRAEVERCARRLRCVQRVVERADRIGWQLHLQLEVREPLHFLRCRHAGAAEQSFERDDEVVERQVRVERRLSARIDAEEAVGAVAAPVHRACINEAAQRLRRHRPLHRMELGRVAGAVDQRARERGHDLEQADLQA